LKVKFKKALLKRGKDTIRIRILILISTQTNIKIMSGLALLNKKLIMIINKKIKRLMI